MYTALSREKTYDNLYCTGKFKKPAIRVNKDALLEFEHLKQNDLFSTVKENTCEIRAIQLQFLFIM